MDTIDGSKISHAYPEYNEYIKILVPNEDRQTQFDVHKEYFLSKDDLLKILQSLDFTAEKKRKRIWITGWKKHTKK